MRVTRGGDFQVRFSCLIRGLLCSALVATGWLEVDAPRVAIAQPKAASESEEDELPDPEEVTLETDDGVTVQATFYGSLEGKNAVPVILLHGFKGDRQDFDELALFLQQAGHAVIAPDLRGHGDSKRQVRGGGTVNLDAARLRKEDFLAMAGKDGEVERVKRFLMTKNNAGELNIDKLCLIGAEMGATVALYWTVRDLTAAILPTGKRGQDVKALVLISPQDSFKGIPTNAALRLPDIQRELSVMLIAGSGDSKTIGDARRIYSSLAKYRPDPPTDPKEVETKQTLFFSKPDTSLSGTKMLNEKSLNLATKIGTFIDFRLVQQKYPWTDRRSRPAAE